MKSELRAPFRCTTSRVFATHHSSQLQVCHSPSRGKKRAPYPIQFRQHNTRRCETPTRSGNRALRRSPDPESSWNSKADASSPTSKQERCARPLLSGMSVTVCSLLEHDPSCVLDQEGSPGPCWENWLPCITILSHSLKTPSNCVPILADLLKDLVVVLA